MPKCSTTPEERAAVVAKKRSNEPNYRDGHELAQKIARYIAKQRAQEEPLTIAGVAIACGMTRQNLWNYGQGKCDGWVIEIADNYRDTLEGDAVQWYDFLIGGPHEGKAAIFPSEVVGKYQELTAEERERRLYKRGGVADIFALKAQDGWQDTSTPQTVNQTLVLNGDSAEEALKALGFTRKQLPSK